MILEITQLSENSQIKIENGIRKMIKVMYLAKCQWNK